VPRRRSIVLEPGARRRAEAFRRAVATGGKARPAPLRRCRSGAPRRDLPRTRATADADRRHLFSSSRPRSAPTMRRGPSSPFHSGSRTGRSHGSPSASARRPGSVCEPARNRGARRPVGGEARRVGGRQRPRIGHHGRAVDDPATARSRRPNEPGSRSFGLPSRPSRERREDRRFRRVPGTAPCLTRLFLRNIPSSSRAVGRPIAVARIRRAAASLPVGRAQEDRGTISGPGAREIAIAGRAVGSFEEGEEP